MAFVFANWNQTKVNLAIMPLQNRNCSCDSDSRMVNIVLRVVSTKKFIMFIQPKRYDLVNTLDKKGFSKLFIQFPSSRYFYFYEDECDYS